MIIAHDKKNIQLVQKVYNEKQLCLPQFLLQVSFMEQHL